MNSNSNSNIDLEDNGTRKPQSRRTQPLRIAASVGVALCLALSGIIATSGSASVVESGFCVKATGFDGKFTGDRAYNCGGERVKMLRPTVAGTPACVLTPGLMGSDPRVALRWSVPDAMRGYTVDQAQLGMVRNGTMEPIATDLLRHVSTTGDPTSYSTTFSAKALSGGLLGSSWTFGVRFVDNKTGAVSGWLAADAEMGAAGMNATCTVGSS